MENQIEPKQIIKSFCVIGLNKNHIKKYKEDNSEKCFVIKVDIILNNIKGNHDKIDLEGEKWTRIIKNRNYWLRVKYASKYHKPITGFTIVECDYESPEFLYIDKGYKLIKIIHSNHHPQHNLQNETEENNKDDECRPLAYNDFYMKIPIEYNIKEELMLNHIEEEQGAVLLVSQSLNELPLKDIKILQCERNVTKGFTANGYRFGIIKCKHPYTFQYMPELLDSYPIDSNINPGVAMFCFPEGISIKTTRELPQWFSFILTDENGQYTYGSVLTFMEELTSDYIKGFTPIYKSSHVYYYQKAICLLSNYPFLSNSRLFLRELYRIQVSSYSLFPLERAICHWVDSLYFQSIDKAISLTFAENDFKFYHTPLYGQFWDINDDNIQLLFQLISIENILTLWEGVLLERRVFLLCKSKLALVNITMGIISLIYPFKWMHVIVPVLPEKLKIFTESPVPLIIGISFDIDINELPNDSLIFNVNTGHFENYIDKMPKLPNKLYIKMMKHFNKIIMKSKDYVEPVNDNNKIRLERIMLLDEVFPVKEVNDTSSSNSSDSSNNNNHEQLKKCIVNSSEIRDIFYEFFIMLFKNYEKYFNWKHKQSKNEPLTFQKDLFLNDHSSNNYGSFLHSFTETTLFSQFEDSFKHADTDVNTAFFIDCIKKGKGKSKINNNLIIKSKDQKRHYLPMTIPSITLVIPEIPIEDLNNHKYSYKDHFPQLNHKLYIKIEAPHIAYHSRFIYTHDEWCFDLGKLSNREWGKYILYSIHEIWFILLTQSITYYNDSKANILMDYTTFLLEDLIYKRKIFPSKSLLKKIIKSCGRNTLNSYMKPLLNLININNQEYNMIFHEAFMNGLLTITESIMNQSNFIGAIGDNAQYHNLRDNRNDMYKTIFLTADLCTNCMKRNKKIRKITTEDIIAGFSRSKNNYSTKCPYCLNSIFPKIHFMHEDQLTIFTDNVNFLSPIVLVKEVDNIIMNKGEKYFYESNYSTDNNHRHIYYNLMLYFKIFGLPLGILFIHNDDEMFGEFVNEMNHSREVRQRPKKLSSKIDKSFEQTNRRTSGQSQSQCNKSTSGKGSIGSSSQYSCKSMMDYFSCLGKYEKELWEGLQGKIERNNITTAINITTITVPVKNLDKGIDKKSDDSDGNDKDGKSLIDKAKLKNKLCDIKTIIAYDIDCFVQSEKMKLDKLLFTIEYQQEIEGKKVVFLTMKEDKNEDANNKKENNKENIMKEANQNDPMKNSYDNEENNILIESHRKNIIKNPSTTTSTFFPLPIDKKRSLNYKIIIKSSKSIISSEHKV